MGHEGASAGSAAELWAYLDRRTPFAAGPAVVMTGCRRRRRPRVWALWLPLLAACCGEPAVEDLEPAWDLAALLPAAEIVTEPGAITFSAPVDRHHLRSGWSRNEHDRGRDRGFAWGVGEASTIDFHLLAPRAFELRLEGRPFAYPGAPAQAVALSVNGSPLAEIELRPRLASYQVAVPPELVAAGANRLELAYRWSRSPRQVSGSGDRRSLAVAWYRIDFGGGEARPPRSAAEPQRLFLPSGSEAAFYLEPAPGSRLLLEGWRWRGTPPGRLEIELQAEHQDGQRIGELEGSGEQAAFVLPGDEKRLVRLALRALPPPGTAPGGIELRAPAVWSPRPAARVEPEPPPATPAVRPTAGEDNPDAAVPNVVLYVIDTLRADRLGCYGGRRPVSPRIDAFAREAVLFEHAVAQSSWTRSAMASIFTGKWPLAHGTNGRDDRLSDAAITLSERLRAAGYRTAARVTNPNVTPGFGFDQGFDDFSYLGETTGSDGVHRAAIDWLGAGAAETPFFLYLHTLDPHAPYVSPEPFRRRLAPDSSAAAAEHSLAVLGDLQTGRRQADAAIRGELEALYDATVAFNDHSFGALLDELEARGLLEETLVILLSDHGEEFLEHGGWQHGRALHAESIDVPLIIKAPGSRGGRRVAQRVRQVDLLPTVLDLLDLPPAASVEGRSLQPLIDGSERDQAPPAFSYLHLDGPARVSVVDRGWKLIQRSEAGRLVHPRLYRIAEDPGETRELAARFPIRAGYLASLIRHKLAGEQAASEAAEIDEETRQALEALGYL